VGEAARNGDRFAKNGLSAPREHAARRNAHPKVRAAGLCRGPHGMQGVLLLRHVRSECGERLPARDSLDATAVPPNRGLEQAQQAS